MEGIACMTKPESTVSISGEICCIEIPFQDFPYFDPELFDGLCIRDDHIT